MYAIGYDEAWRTHGVVWYSMCSMYDTCYGTYGAVWCGMLLYGMVWCGAV